jgi:hypothetical protein
VNEAQRVAAREELIYASHSLPGWQVSRFSMRDDRTLFLFIFRDAFLTNHGDPKTLLRQVFAGAVWEWPHIEAELDRATDIYFDSVSQIRLNHWTRGRIALVGDAAACGGGACDAHAGAPRDARDTVQRAWGGVGQRAETSALTAAR